MAPGITPERRRSPRLTAQLPVAISEAGMTVEAETNNLSASGAYCTLDRFLPPMSKLQLRLELPNGRSHTSIRCAGVVVRIEPVIAHAQQSRYHVAIFFTDLAERDRSAIARFVQQRLSATPATD